MMKSSKVQKQDIFKITTLMLIRVLGAISHWYMYVVKEAKDSIDEN